MVQIYLVLLFYSILYIGTYYNKVAANQRTVVYVIVLDKVTRGVLKNYPNCLERRYRFLNKGVFVSPRTFFLSFATSLIVSRCVRILPHTDFLSTLN